MTAYTVTCSSMSEKDTALIKSLFGIIGKGQGAEWSYVDAAEADVVIIDPEAQGGRSALKKGVARALIVYASPDQTLIPNSFVLSKPARARDLLDVLASVHQKLASA
jgi:hypothetical protein